MDILLICITVIMVLIIFGLSFYMFIVYCHSQQKSFGSSIPSKIVVVFGLGLTWGQLLLVPLDVANSNSNGGIDMLAFYSIVYIIIYIFVTALVPFMIFMYESDEDDPFIKRFLWSLFATFLVQVFTSLLVFLSYNWLSVYAVVNDQKYRMYVTLYMFLCLSFVGWFLLALFGGIGLLSLPIDLIVSFVHRPKPLKPQEAKQKKKQIQEQSSRLVEEGEALKQQQLTLSKSQEGWWSRRKQMGQLGSRVDAYKKDVVALEQESETFMTELDLSKSNPALAFIGLIVGIICLFLSIIWIIQLLIGVVIRKDGEPLYGFVNNLLAHLNSQGLNFISTGIFGVLTIYLLWCVQKGNLSFGIRIPFIMSFHPMKKNQTYLNSFLFNINLMLLASTATTQLSVFAFQSYTYPVLNDDGTWTAGSLIGNTFQYQISKLPLFGVFYNRRIFPIIMICVTILQGIYSIVKHFIIKRKAKKRTE